MDARRSHCATFGHVKNCVTPPSKTEDFYWCAYCATEIDKEKYLFARGEWKKGWNDNG
jgi:hypothetical protein